MIEEMLRNNLIIREWLNGGLLPLNISLVLSIGLFLWTTRREYGPGWSKVDGVPTACALLWIFASDGIRAGLVWNILYKSNAHAPMIEAASVSMVLINIGLVLAGIAGLTATMRCIYLFTPPRLGHWYWLASIVATFLFQIATKIFQ